MGAMSIIHWILLLVIFGIPLLLIFIFSRRRPNSGGVAAQGVNRPMSWKRLFFGLEGRIRRREWWLSHLAQWIGVTVAALTVVALVSDGTEGKDLPTWAIIFIVVAYLVLIWTTICINAKRWHDRDKSGWWQLIGLIPLIGIWALIENDFLRGTDGPNRFGNDPLDS